MRPLFFYINILYKRHGQKMMPANLKLFFKQTSKIYIVFSISRVTFMRPLFPILKFFINVRAQNDANLKSLFFKESSKIYILFSINRVLILTIRSLAIM